MFTVQNYAIGFFLSQRVNAPEKNIDPFSTGQINILPLDPVPPGWLSGEHVRLMTWWL